LKKIDNIEISNFKSIKHLKIDGCKKINVFVGMPNAGKSNILEALGLFGFLEKSNVNLKDFVRYKNFSDLFFEGNFTDDFTIIETKETTLALFFKNGELKLHNKNKEFNISTLINIDGTGNSKLTKKELEEIIHNVNPVKKYSFNGVTKNISSKETDLTFPFGNNIGQIISSIPRLRNQVNGIFKQNNLKLLIEKGTNELKIFKEYQDGTVFTLPYEMIADTIQRLIFYKAAIMSNKETVLLFEEPEAHCFEPYILEFTNDVKYDENDNQFFIVTHSDFIIKEFLRDEESKENTNIYLVNNIDGETQVKLLEKDKNEDVYEYGMNVFFNFESLWETN
jgi:AAA15 family ATPase/GTPase